MAFHPEVGGEGRGDFVRQVLAPFHLTEKHYFATSL
jgi:hypothetical protein